MSFTHCGEFRPSLKASLILAADPLRVTKKEHKIVYALLHAKLTGVWTLASFPGLLHLQFLITPQSTAIQGHTVIKEQSSLYNRIAKT